MTATLPAGAPGERARVRQSRTRVTEQGFTLAGLLVILTVLAVVVAYTLPRMWSDVLRRERDLQTIWAMKQYARSIRDYQTKRGALPSSLKDLQDQNNPRILRQLYPDPLTGEVDWILIPAGTPSAVAPPRNPQTGGAIGSAPGEQIGKPIGKPLEGASGPFIGVRPPKTGESLIEFRGFGKYEEWSYTVTDLQTDLGAGGPTPPPQATPTPPPAGSPPPKP